MNQVDQESSFFGLTPERVLDCAELFGPRATGRFSILPSYENRVYQIELEEPLRYLHGDVEKETTFIVGKFYRPLRWSREALLEEHQICEALVKAEVPTVPWLPLTSGAGTLGVTSDGIYFGFTPRVYGRAEPEPSAEQMQWLGRLLTRMHNVLKQQNLKHRTVWGTASLKKSYESLKHSGWLHDPQKDHLAKLFELVVPSIEKVSRKFPSQAIHGDCHFGNILWDKSGPFFLDFDDAMVGPAPQDLWLILDAPVTRGHDLLCQGYEAFSEWPDLTASDIAVFRAYRMMSYAGWVAARFHDPAFKRVFSQYPESRTWDIWFEDYARVIEQFGVS